MQYKKRRSFALLFLLGSISVFAMEESYDNDDSFTLYLTDSTGTELELVGYKSKKNEILLNNIYCSYHMCVTGYLSFVIVNQQNRMLLNSYSKNSDGNISGIRYIPADQFLCIDSVKINKKEAEKKYSLYEACFKLADKK